jgi:hypothetical protein
LNNIAQNTKITSTDINNLISELNGKLNLSGGTMTGQIKFTSGNSDGWVSVSSNTGDCYVCSSERTDTGRKIAFGIGTSGENRGIWDGSCEDWLIYRDTNNVLKSGSSNILMSPYNNSFIREITDYGTAYSVLSVKSPNYTTAIITASEPSADTNAGTNIKIGGNANTVIGSGESPTSCMNELLTSTSEGMYITSDGSITFHVNAQTYANKKTFAFLSDGKIQTPTGTIWIA